MVPIGRRWPCAEGFYWPGTLLLTVILWVFTFSFKSIYNCEDKRSIWRDLEYRKTYHKSVRTHIVCDARTKQNVKHGRDLIAADVCTILIHVFEVFYWANTSNQSNNWDHSLVIQEKSSAARMFQWPVGYARIPHWPLSILRKLTHDFDAFSIWVMHSLGS